MKAKFLALQPFDEQVDVVPGPSRHLVADGLRLLGVLGLPDRAAELPKLDLLSSCAGRRSFRRR